MKKFLIIVLILLATGLYAQYGVCVRFIDCGTLMDYTDVSYINFEVELLDCNGDIQIGPSGLCFVTIADVGAGEPHSFIQFDLANFANPYTLASNISVTIMENFSSPSTVIYNVADDLIPAGGFMGWGQWFGVSGSPIIINVPGCPAIMDWGNGVYGFISDDEYGLSGGAVGGIGYGSGLPNEDMLECVLNGYPEGVGYWFTMHLLYDTSPIEIYVQMGLDEMGFVPFNLAYYLNDEWNYYPEDTSMPLTWNVGYNLDYVSFSIDLPTTRFEEIEIPLVLAGIFPPENVIIEITNSNVHISWDEVAGVTSYKVYSSDDPYTGFVEDLSGSFTGESWITSIINEKKYYYVTAGQ